jgi:hypothetical protein
MVRKLLRGLLFLVFMGLVPVACCREERDYANIRELLLYLSEPGVNSPALLTGARTSAPELMTTVRLQYDYLTAAPTSSLFGSQAMAFQCEGPGIKGLKDKVASITFTSLGLFNGVAAGQSLEQFVRCSGGNSKFQNLRFPLAQLADSLNTWKAGEFDGQLDIPLELYISPLPRDNAQQQFQLRIQLQSGKEVVQTTPAIIWN